MGFYDPPIASCPFLWDHAIYCHGMSGDDRCGNAGTAGGGSFHGGGDCRRLHQSGGCWICRVRTDAAPVGCDDARAAGDVVATRVVATPERRRKLCNSTHLRTFKSR
jgi:hypothetical protein